MGLVEYVEVSSQPVSITMAKTKRVHYSAVGDGVSKWKRLSRWAKQRKLQLLLAAVVVLTIGYILLNGIPKKARILQMQGTDKAGLTIQGNEFRLDGRPFRILSGSIHYFRVPRAYWRDRLAKLKAAGLNTVDTYVAWNLHEEERGHFDYTGNLDLVEFLSIARELGLYAVLRPGPYICAEWDWGGLPPWLLSDSQMKVRTLHEGFTEAVEAFFADLFNRVGSLQYSKTKGGPIIAVQIENEYGAYSDDKKYLLWLKELLQNQGVVEFLFTSDGPEDLERGYTPGVFSSVNYNFKTDDALNALEKFQPNKPLMTGEFWPGWFDHWTEKHHTLPADDLVRRLEPIFKRRGSVNLYMFHGGSNFGFMNGANLVFPGQEGVLSNLWNKFSNLWSSNSQQLVRYQPTITSYDYDAPLNEYGGKTKKYEALRQLILQYQTDDEKAMVKNAADPWATSRSPVAHGDFPVESSLSLTDALELMKPLPIELQTPLFVEKIVADSAHQLYYGFVVYRTSVGENVKIIKIDGCIGDRMMVVANGKTVATLYSQYNLAQMHWEVDISTTLQAGKTTDLIILVENMGRANYAKIPHKLDGMFKGFNGTVKTDDSTVLDKWRIYSLRFHTPSKMQKLSMAATAKSLWKPASRLTAEQPAFYKLEFNTKDATGEFPDDTFVSTKDWSKGVVYANGVNLGRYWDAGPTKTLYLPGVWLKKSAKNELVIFELHKPATTVKLQAEPELGAPCPIPCYS